MRKKEESKNQTKMWRRLVGPLSVALASGLLALAGSAQSWQKVTQPKLGIPSSIALAPDDANRVFVTAEHDGAWDINIAKSSGPLWLLTAPAKM